MRKFMDENFETSQDYEKILSEEQKALLIDKILLTLLEFFL